VWVAPACRGRGLATTTIGTLAIHMINARFPAI
jgi:predicted GNAT family acetyltransferase